jgi:endonuclease YncB( thermonuclease family)
MRRWNLMLPMMLAGAIAAVCTCYGATPQPAATLSCGGERVARGSVSRIEDGADFVLDDGRQVHLAGIEVPPVSSPRQSVGAPGGAAAKSALAAFLAGAQVELRRTAYSPDRYGRIVAYADAVRGTDTHLAQAELLAAGMARVGDLVGSADCAAQLLRREREARAAKLGLWASPYYAVLEANDPASVLAQWGRFALVAGKVVSVHQSGATLYINFGQHWSDDFTVTIWKRNKRNFTAAGVDLDGLGGRRVLVRGVVERRGGLHGAPWGGPSIEAVRPEQIETTDVQ